MNWKSIPWDYLILTASNESQASAYESQLEIRRRRGALSRARHVLVVADPEGKRVGSGGSTIGCLMEVVNREWTATPDLPSWTQKAETILRRLRILIVHAGGDSRRLPAYGPCGKIFIPVPGTGRDTSGTTLFDRLVPSFLKLPPGYEDVGQVVMAAGDALILFDRSNVSLRFPGLTALTCPDTPEQASKHGVFCATSDGRVRRYLQKPGVAEQHRRGAVDRHGQSLLDLGIMSFDSTVAMALFRAFGIRPGQDGKLDWLADMKRAVLTRGLDFFREICCALGTHATAEHHRRQAHGAGSRWSNGRLAQIFRALTGVPFHLQVVPQTRFLHFGTTRQLITSGTELRQRDRGTASAKTILSIDNRLLPGAEIVGNDAWVEGCRLHRRLILAGHNVVVGVDVNKPLALPAGACLDLLRGKSRVGKSVWFVRCYGVDDNFKESVANGATFCGQPLSEWLAQVGANPEVVWGPEVPSKQRSLWNARVFPAETKHGAYRQWLWMFEPSEASPAEKEAFRSADRYSAAEIVLLADQEHFFARRRRLMN